MKTKRCTKCGSTKPITKFPPDKHMLDGISSWCRECKKLLMRNWRRDHPDKSLEMVTAYQKNNPDKRKSRTAIANAIESGKLQKSFTCAQNDETCSGRLEAHHWSYETSHKLDVIWLCTSHHKRLHHQAGIKS